EQREPARQRAGFESRIRARRVCPCNGKKRTPEPCEICRKFYYVYRLAVKRGASSTAARHPACTTPRRTKWRSFRMRIPHLRCVTGLFGAVAAAPVAAQERRGPVPAPGMVGVGASFGASIPTDDRLKSGPEVTGNIEGSLTRRLSVRGRVGATWEDFTGQRF